MPNHTPKTDPSREPAKHQIDAAEMSWALLTAANVRKSALNVFSLVPKPVGMAGLLTVGCLEPCDDDEDV